MHFQFILSSVKHNRRKLSGVQTTFSLPDKESHTVLIDNFRWSTSLNDGNLSNNFYYTCITHKLVFLWWQQTTVQTNRITKNDWTVWLTNTRKEDNQVGSVQFNGQRRAYKFGMTMFRWSIPLTNLNDGNLSKLYFRVGVHFTQTGGFRWQQGA